MEIALSVRSKLEFVQGLRPKPTDATLATKWKRCNDVITTWLLNSLSKKVVSHILHAKDTASAWRILHSRYASSNVSRKFYLKKEVSNIKQGDLDIANYFEKLNAFWKEELPSLDTVYDMDLNDESQQKVTKHSFVEASALYSNQQDSHGYAKGQMRNTQGNTQGKAGGRLFCTHCQMSGHTKDFCYKLNGYHPGHKMYKGNMRNTSRGNDNTKSVNMASVDNITSKEKAESSQSEQLPQLSSA
ncbi:unnamed protein product [Rhodiola kirilowii]